MGCGASTETDGKNKRKAGPKAKFMLLGSSNVGKSTFFKQLRIKYMETPFNSAQIEWAGNIARLNLFHNVYTLGNTLAFLDGDHPAAESFDDNDPFMDDLDSLSSIIIDQQSIVSPRTQSVLCDFEPKEGDSAASEFSPTASRAALFPPEAWEIIMRIYNDKRVQKFYEKRNEIVGLESALVGDYDYFLKTANVDRIRDPGYEPIANDILRIRRSTSGADTLDLEIEVTNRFSNKTVMGQFKFVDVGGQAHEESEWLLHTNNLNGIIYMMALGEFDRPRPDGRSCLESQFDLLRSICSCSEFQDSVLVVLLNKTDAFQKKMAFYNKGNGGVGGSSVKRFYPDSDGPCEYEPLVTYFREKVTSILKSGKNTTSQLPAEQLSNCVMETCAVDPNVMSRVIDGCLDIFRSVVIRETCKM